MNWFPVSSKEPTTCSPSSFSISLFMYQRVISQLLQIATAPIWKSWVADGSRGPCVNSTDGYCSVCMHVCICSRDPPGLVGSCSSTDGCQGSTERGGRERGRQVPVLQQCRSSEGEGCQWNEEREKNEMLTGKQGSTQMSDACLESMFATLTSLCWFSFWERFCTVSLFCWSIHLTLWLWQYHPQPNLAETTSPGKANTPCWASHVSSLPCPLNKQLSLWRLHGREGDLSGLLTGSLSGLLFHPVVNTALLGRPMAGVFTSRQRK